MELLRDGEQCSPAVWVDGAACLGTMCCLASSCTVFCASCLPSEAQCPVTCPCCQDALPVMDLAKRPWTEASEVVNEETLSPFKLFLSCNLVSIKNSYEYMAVIGCKFKFCKTVGQLA